MYGPLWRALPGPWPAKVAACLVLLLGVVAVCFTWVFPRMAPLVPFNENTVTTPKPKSGNAAGRSAGARAATSSTSASTSASTAAAAVSPTALPSLSLLGHQRQATLSHG